MALFNTDIPELSGFDTGLCLSNLDILGGRQNRVSESVLAVLSELADAILRDASGESDTVDSILLSLRSNPEGDDGGDAPTAPRPSDVSTVNQDLFRRMSAQSGLLARLVLYTMIEERMPTQHPLAKPSALTAAARGRIAYMPTAFADKAYLRLAAHVKSPRAAATSGFVDACEEVHSGLCEYCILPLENTQSGKLTAFTRLILRYRLRITAVCDLENAAAEGQVTRFALLKNASDEEFPAPLIPPPAGEPLYLELMHTSDSLTLTELLTAAEFCGMSLCRADTLPGLDDTGMESDAPVLSCVLNAAEGDLPVFRRFLSLEASEDILLGLYGLV
jgi:hypothetical protein